MSSIPFPTTKAAPAPAAPSPATTPQQQTADDKGKDIIGDFFKKLGGDFLTKLLAKAPGPVKAVAAGIELIKVGVPLVKKIFGGLFGKKEPDAPKQTPGANPALAGPGGKLDLKALLADPKAGPALNQLMQLGGLSAIQRAAQEGRLPRDIAGIEAIYRQGAQAVLEQGLPAVGRSYERDADEHRAIDELKPYLSDVKVSARDLGILLDERRSFDERYRAFERILEDVTRPQERAKERPQEKDPEKKETEQDKSKEAAQAWQKDVQDEEKTRKADANAPVENLVKAAAFAPDAQTPSRIEEKTPADREAAGKDAPADKNAADKNAPDKNSPSRDTAVDKNPADKEGRATETRGAQSQEPRDGNVTQRPANNDPSQARAPETAPTGQNPGQPAQDKAAMPAAAPVERSSTPAMPAILDQAPMMGGLDRSR